MLIRLVETLSSFYIRRTQEKVHVRSEIEVGK